VNVLAFGEVITNRFLPSIEGHVATLTFARVNEDVVLPLIYVPEAFTRFEKRRMIGLLAGLTIPLRRLTAEALVQISALVLPARLEHDPHSFT